MKTLQPAPTRAWVDGPALAPGDALVPWLTGPGSAEDIQIPVLVSWSALGVTGARVGVEPLPADAPAIQLDETALGIALIDQLRSACPGVKTCAVWLEGRMGVPSALAGPSFAGSKPVLRVSRFVGPAEPTVTHLRVPAPPTAP